MCLSDIVPKVRPYGIFWKFVVWWFLVASQVSDMITASVSLDQTENPGVHFTNLVAQLQLAILNYNEVQISIVTGPLFDIDYFQIVHH